MFFNFLDPPNFEPCEQKNQVLTMTLFYCDIKHCRSLYKSKQVTSYDTI